MPDLLASFQALADSIKNVSIGNSIARAQTKVDQIRADQSMNEFKKIEAQQALAKAVGGDIAAYGGNAFMVQQAMSSLAPDVPDGKMAQLEATGKATIPEAAKALRDEDYQRKLTEEKMKLDNLIKVQNLKSDTAVDVADMKAAAVTSKRVSEMRKALDPSGPRAGNFGAAQKTAMAAQRLEGLFQQFPDYNVPKAQTTEIATAVASMISGGSPQSQHQIDMLVPDTGRGRAADIQAFLTNNPNGREQQAFMKLAHETAIREKGIAEDQINTIQNQRLSEFGDVKSQYPDVYNQVVGQFVKKPLDTYAAPATSSAAPYQAPGSHAPGAPADNSGNAPQTPYNQPGLSKYIRFNP